MDGTDFTALTGIGGAFVVVALCQVVKQTAGLSDTVWKRIVAALAILIGIGLNFVVLREIGSSDLRWETILMLGIQSGLSGMGLWSSGKAIVETTQAPPQG
jgi:high-affinity Fe2+/Pb2+ permease